MIPTFKTLGHSIRQAMRAARMTVVEFADAIPAGNATVHRWFNGEGVKPETIVRISEVTGCKRILNVYCGQCPVGQAKKEMRLRKNGAQDKTA